MLDIVLPVYQGPRFIVDLAHRLWHWCSIALYFRRGKLGSFMDIAFVWNDVCVCVWRILRNLVETENLVERNSVIELCIGETDQSEQCDRM